VAERPSAGDGAMMCRCARRRPHSARRPPGRRSKPPRTPGTPATPSGSRRPTPRTRSGANAGRAEIVAFLTRKWERELDYALRKDLWAFSGNRIAVRFQYESRDADGQWWRSYGNEQWDFDDEGYMRRREASINDVAIGEEDRRIVGPRPEEERGAPIPLR
jgi:uncharacterized protein